MRLKEINDFLINLFVLIIYLEVMLFIIGGCDSSLCLDVVLFGRYIVRIFILILLECLFYKYYYDLLVLLYRIELM